MLEATFIAQTRLTGSPRVHLATIYLVWAGTWLSAYFILAANSWMQHPVGYEINSQTGRAWRPRMIFRSSSRASCSSPGGMPSSPD